MVPFDMTSYIAGYESGLAQAAEDNDHDAGQTVDQDPEEGSVTDQEQ